MHKIVYFTCCKHIAYVDVKIVNPTYVLTTYGT